jgi:hypothetical protein
MKKRSRDADGSRLDLDCHGHERENARLVADLQVSHDMVNVVTVHGDPCELPAGVEAVTDSILCLTDHFPNSVPAMLQANEKLHVYIYSQHIALDDVDDPFDWQIDRQRVHAAHVIMYGLPATFELYTRCYAELQQSSSQVYQLLEPGLNMQWTQAAGVTKFVIEEHDFQLRDMLGLLPPGSVAFHLDSLKDTQAAWTEQATAALEAGHVPKFRRLAARGEKVLGDQSVRFSPKSLRDKMHAMTGGPIQNPALTSQLYHMFEGDDRLGNQWIRYLDAQHPRFCTLDDGLFFYKVSPHEVEPVSAAEASDIFQTFTNVKQRRQGRNHVRHGTLGVNRRLPAALDECPRPFMVGTLWIWANGVGHSNAIIIDVKKGIVSRYEPLGSERLSFYDQDKVDQLFRDLVRDTPQYFSEYVPPSQFCTADGAQHRADRGRYNDFEDPREFLGLNGSGWCHLASLMFIHYVMAYPEKSLREVEEVLASKSAGQLAIELRSYANNVVRSTVKIITQCDPKFCTTIKMNEAKLQAQTCMTEAYPPTDFSRLESLTGAPQALVRATANIEKDHSVRLCTIRTKMTETQPRKTMGPGDEVAADSELFTWYHLLDMVPEAKTLRLDVTTGFPWYVDDLRGAARATSVSRMVADLKTAWGVDSREFKQLLAANVDPNELKGYKASDQCPTLTKAWIAAKSITHRAAYYQDTMGFVIEQKSPEGIDLSCTRANIHRKFDAVFNLPLHPH